MNHLLLVLLPELVIQQEQRLEQAQAQKRVLLPKQKQEPTLVMIREPVQERPLALARELLQPQDSLSRSLPLAQHRALVLPEGSGC